MTAQISQVGSVFVASLAPDETASRSGRALLRLEGLAALVVAVAIYAHRGFSWPLRAALPCA